MPSRSTCSMPRGTYTGLGARRHSWACTGTLVRMHRDDHGRLCRHVRALLGTCRARGRPPSVLGVTVLCENIHVFVNEFDQILRLILVYVLVHKYGFWLLITFYIYLDDLIICGRFPLFEPYLPLGIHLFGLC